MTLLIIAIALVAAWLYFRWVGKDYLEELPALTNSEVYNIGWRMGERGILPSEWDTTFQKECLFLQHKKLETMRVHGESLQQLRQKILEHNAKIEAETEVERVKERVEARLRTITS